MFLSMLYSIPVITCLSIALIGKQIPKKQSRSFGDRLCCFPKFYTLTLALQVLSKCQPPLRRRSLPTLQVCSLLRRRYAPTSLRLLALPVSQVPYLDFGLGTWNLGLR